ncbi:MAG: GtrA family protein [Dokdonella sp.]|uniref:GtrA family protein n=1 Tax=Dokdonella sp. TaxID=2291710 RepID=UPI002C5D9E04|nr:GtrA family protein [Xanthomonadales bacterium]HQZ63113.1 GtrA family protein [Dokdonella sp.]
MNHEHEVPGITWPTRARAMAGEFVRFLIMGGANTIVAYAIYLLLLQWMRYEFAYSIGYGIGIVMAYGLSAIFVFRKPMRRRSALRFPLVYLAQFLISLGLLRLAVEVIDIPQWLAFGFAVVLTIPVTFLLSRWVLHSG